MTNWYTTLDRCRAIATIPDTDLDARISRAIETASRQIDLYCGRAFFVQTAVRDYTPTNPRRLLVDDLLSISDLAYDYDLDGVFELDIAADQYNLAPYNALSESPPSPFWEIELRRLAAWGFPVFERSVRISGQWGYSDVRQELVSGLTAPGVNASVTAWPVEDATEFETGMTLWAESEQVFVSAVGDTDITVQRAQNGSTAASHTDAIALFMQTYPEIDQACELTVARALNRQHAPLGIVSSPDLGTTYLRAALDPDARVILSPFRRMTA